MKVDVGIVGSFITDEEIIIKALRSIPEYDYHKKWILFDGIPPHYDEEDQLKYTQYKERIKRWFPDFTVIQFDKNIYYREMVHHLVKNSVADEIFIIQDDVAVNPLNLQKIIDDKNKSSFEILCFPEKPIPMEKGWWYEPFNIEGEYILSHGWTERVYLTSREWIKNILDNLKYVKNKWCINFIEEHYRRTMKLVKWKTMTADEKFEYWKQWKCALLNTTNHKHLRASRGSKKYKKSN
jgi:hypothetical protein